MRQPVVTAALLLAVTVVLISGAPARALEGRYEGEATFVVGTRHCPLQGPALNFEIHADGKVVGGVKNAAKPLSFSGTIGPDGKLTTSYKAADTETVAIEATVNDRQLEGFAQQASCKYKLSFQRQ
jgi:hypothetical protein